jgi:type III secretion protein Q
VSAAARHRPFPWATLDSTTRADAAALRGVRWWAAAHIDSSALARATRELIGCEVRLLVHHVRPVTALRALDEGVGALLAGADMAAGRCALVVAEPPLAAAIVARAVGRAVPSAVHAIAVPTAGVAGAFAALLVGAARRTHGRSPLRVIAAGPAAALEAALAQEHGELVAVTLTALVADDPFMARIVMARDAVLTSPAPPWSAQALASLGSIRLGLPVVACVARASAAEVGALRTGDVFLPGSWPLSRAADGVLSGPVVLAPPSSEVGIRAQLAEGGRLVLGGSGPVDAAEGEMSDSEDRGGALLGAIGEVPVVVRVEIGEARMAARDWASLGRGDVVALGRRVGERVVLRVGGVPVARGELVEIDGEVGVRIAERMEDEGTTP